MVSASEHEDAAPTAFARPGGMGLPWRLGVVIPAHDDAEHIAANVRSVLASLDAAVAAGKVVRDESFVVVCAYGCRDRTLPIALRALRGYGTVVTTEVAHSPSAARRRGAREVLDRLEVRTGEHCWLLTTDADTKVPESWVLSHLREAERGAAAVAGEVRGADRSLTHSDGLSRNPCTNLGVRADAYLHAGGWQDDTDDARLWDLIQDAGLPTSTPTDCWVAADSRSSNPNPA